MANQTLCSSKTLWARLSKNCHFALRTSSYYSDIWKKRSFGSKKSVLTKKTISKWSWKLSKVKSWPKPDIENNAYTKLFKFQTLTQLNFCFLSLMIGELPWSHRKFQKTEIWRKLGRVMTKNLFAQATLENILETK